MLIVTLVTAGEEEFCARANLSSICREREKQKLVRNKQKEKPSDCRYITELRNGINWIISLTFFFIRDGIWQTVSSVSLILEKRFPLRGLMGEIAETEFQSSTSFLSLA